MKEVTKLSLIIPCYNEEQRFSEGIKHYLNYLNKQKYPWELLLVNDGSRDNTLQLLKKTANANPKIKVISYKKNKGKGFAITQGVKQASGKYILFSDIDHSVSIDTVEQFYKHFDKGIQVVIGSRRVGGAIFIKKQSLMRELLGRGFSILVRILIDFKIKDTTCGFKAFEKKAAKKIFDKITIFDWAFDAEIIFLCKKYDIKIYQAPVSWKDVSGSKVSLQRDIIKSMMGLVKIRLNDFKNIYK